MWAARATWYDTIHATDFQNKSNYKMWNDQQQQQAHLEQKISFNSGSIESILDKIYFLSDCMSLIFEAIIK